MIVSRAGPPGVSSPFNPHLKTRPVDAMSLGGGGGGVKTFPKLYRDRETDVLHGEIVDFFIGLLVGRMPR